jgi:short-subunit dehydrogenase
MTKTVLVTGASSGIGEETVKMLLKKGYKVYAAARRVERMKNLEQEGAQLLELDVTSEDSMVQAISLIQKNSGGVDVLVNNAGYGSYGAIEDVTIDEAKRQFEVNVFGLARLTQLVLPSMREKGSGRIINISSVAGKIYEPLGGWYHSTKHAVEGLSDCMRLELKPFGIHVVLIQPAAIRTEWSGIAADSLLKTSGESVYKEQAILLSNLFRNMFTERTASGPDAIALKILKAIETKKPKTRYPAGKGAKLILTARKLLSDKLFDRMFMATLQNSK